MSRCSHYLTRQARAACPEKAGGPCFARITAMMQRMLRSFKNGLYITGDLAWQDEDGYFMVCEQGG